MKTILVMTDSVLCAQPSIPQSLWATKLAKYRLDVTALELFVKYL